MRRALVLIILSLLASSPAMASPSLQWSWTDQQTLERWIEMAPQDALPKLSVAGLEEARDARDAEATNQAATELALKLARMHLLGRARSRERFGWHIVDADRETELEPMLKAALASNRLDAFFALMRPTHPEYSALRAAYQVSQDPAERTKIARNMERWRWMPRDLGEKYVLVNAARFEAELWRGGEKTRTWRVIVGKRSTPTPSFSTEITGVIFNPWWNIPESIVRESVGDLVERNPAAARARGYVWENGRYRQRPGPNNALGQMKLVMPNRFAVYLHDTPNRDLFNRETRALSHGCVRTGDAVGFAAMLLDGIRTRQEIDAIVATGRRTEIALASPVPVYIAYFTAIMDGRNGVAMLNDIYGRDRRIDSPTFSAFDRQKSGDWTHRKTPYGTALPSSCGSF